MPGLPHPDSDDTGAGPDRRSTAPTPLWVKVFAIIALVVVLVFVVLLLTGRGHGPGRHTGAGGDDASSSGHIERP